MRILFVHEVSWFNKVVFEMHDFPELLSLNGHEVHFLDFDEGEPRAKWRPLTTIETRAHEGSRVAVTTPPRFLPGILGRLLATIIQPRTQYPLVVGKSSKYAKQKISQSLPELSIFHMRCVRLASSHLSSGLSAMYSEMPVSSPHTMKPSGNTA